MTANKGIAFKSTWPW